ncbi:uncharacterized mitochondrial protein AtMg00810-like [Macadamia integrifolia]|uniref:uncharacterized mitochondrial protein AtMg00810-like n=1 Tax=Macadamia integrifolia TaxID=60698 RepID=UPI001C4F1237|nr:uncharacterized mitochondrial protein AtMg00810-like [Macadamia integrifolia]
MGEEFTALLCNGTWSLVPHSPFMNLIRYKWVFQVKRRADGSLECYKALSLPKAFINSMTFKIPSALGGVSMQDPTLYRSVVGALQYVTLTRPNVSIALNKACQFMHAPMEDNWQLVKCILRYLKHTSTSDLLIERISDSRLQAFTDADWAGKTDDHRSIASYTIFLGPNLIS